MRALPRLLETYAEARMLLEAKGWPLAAAAEHLAEMPELKRFHISQAKISKRTTPGSKVPIEPEVAAAAEEMETRARYERQTEIVTAGLRAAQGDPPAAEVRAGQRAWRFLRKLAERFGRAFWRPILITAGSRALVGCLALLLLAPLLPGRANAAQPGPLVLIVEDAGPDGSPVRFEPGSLLAAVAWGETMPAEQQVPVAVAAPEGGAPQSTEAEAPAVVAPAKAPSAPDGQSSTASANPGKAGAPSVPTATAEQRSERDWLDLGLGLNIGILTGLELRVLGVTVRPRLP